MAQGMRYVATIYGKRYGLLPMHKVDFKECSFETRGKYYSAGTVIETYDSVYYKFNVNPNNNTVSKIKDLTNKELKVSSEICDFLSASNAVISTKWDSPIYAKQHFSSGSGDKSRENVFLVEITTKFFVFSGQRTTSDGGKTHNLLFYPLFVMDTYGQFDISDPQMELLGVDNDLYWVYSEEADDLLKQMKEAYQRKLDRTYMMFTDEGDKYYIYKESYMYNIPFAYARTFEDIVGKPDKFVKREFSRKIKRIEAKMKKERIDYIKNSLIRPCLYGMKSFPSLLVSGNRTLPHTDTECNRYIKYIHKVREGEKRIVTNDVFIIVGAIIIGCFIKLLFEANIGLYKLASEFSPFGVFMFVLILWGVPLFFVSQIVINIIEKQSGREFEGTYFRKKTKKQLSNSFAWERDKEISDFDKQRDLTVIGSADVENGNDNEERNDENV